MIVSRRALSVTQTVVCVCVCPVNCPRPLSLPDLLSCGFAPKSPLCTALRQRRDLQGGTLSLNLCGSCILSH
eukprot:4270414-Amphidinium_carterae.1